MNKKYRLINYTCKILLLLMFYIVQQFPAVMIEITVLLGNIYNKPWPIYIPFILTAIIVLSFMITIYYKTQRITEKKIINLKSISYITVTCIFCIALNLILLILMRNDICPNHNVRIQQNILKNVPVIYLIYSLLIAPATEEIFFRGYFINWLFSKNQKLGVVISSLVFGLLHVSQDFIYFLSKFLLGLILGIIYIRCQNIKANVFVHFFNNILAFLLPLVLVYLGE